MTQGIDLNAVRRAEMQKRLLLAEHSATILGPILAIEMQRAMMSHDEALGDKGDQFQVNVGGCIDLAMQSAGEILRRCGL